MRERNFGLDLIRASAILFVLVNHILNYFISFNKSTVIGDVSGIFGVELFFVLSGFLIGRILLTEFAVDSKLSIVKKFYFRRWFRTLPLYYFLLVIFLIILAVSTKVINLHPEHFFFLQNFNADSLRFFGVSWSLAIEEWFYLLMPLILLAAYKMKIISKKVMHFLLILVIVIILARLLYVVTFVPSFDDIRKHIFFRFDSLLIGVLLAGFKLYDHAVYRHLQRPVSAIAALLSIGIMAVLFIKATSRDLLDTSLFAKVFALPLLSIFIAMLIPYFENSKLINTFFKEIKIFRWIIVWISILSYSVYLVHTIIFETIKNNFEKKADPLFLFAVALIITFCVAYLLYRFIEKPFMQMREKIAKK